MNPFKKGVSSPKRRHIRFLLLSSSLATQIKKMDKKKLIGIVKEFNRWRYPECRAKTIKNDDEKLIMQFDGTFSYSCCFDEHFEDFRIILEEKGEKFKITEVKHIGEKFVVRYEKEEANEK